MKLSDLVPMNLLGAGTDDAVSLLIADHDKVKELFKQFEKIKDVTGAKATSERQRIAAEVCGELTVHTTIEEELFYPAVRKAIGDDDLMNEAQVEHDGAKDLIAQLEKMSAKDEMFNAKFKVLSEYIDHHVKEEQNDMFPKARKTDVDLVALGEQMVARKEELKGAMPSTKRSTGRKHGAAVRKSSTSPSRTRHNRQTASVKHQD